MAVCTRRTVEIVEVKRTITYSTSGTRGLHETVTLHKDEVIDILKNLEGLKRKLQALIKT